MRWCHTDLGANVFRWPRLVKEDRRLGSPAANAQEHQAEHFDGLFADSIKSDGDPPLPSLETDQQRTVTCNPSGTILHF